MKKRVIKFPSPKEYRPPTPKEEALIKASIKKTFSAGKIEMAPTDKLNAIDDSVMEDFFKHVLHMNFYDCFISDMSSLHDFPENSEVYVARINKKYGKDFRKDKRLIIYNVVRKIFRK